MTVDDLPAIDDFINSVSDQAAAWYSIVADKPVAIPSATIAAQTNVANAPLLAGTVSTPIGSGIIGAAPGAGMLDWIIIAAAAVAIFYVVKG